MPKITVAIATGRGIDDTHYYKWMRVRRAFLNRDLQSRHLNGEFGALLAAVLDEKLDYHIEYQIRALEKGTRAPDRIIIVDRVKEEIGGMEYYGSEGRDIIVSPMMSSRELELMPASALSGALDRRSNKVSMGCSDKNTAIALCETEYLLMLDDCCLPGFGLVEAAYRACDAGHILLVGHQQMYLDLVQDGHDRWDLTKIEVAQANWTDEKTVYTVEQAKEVRRVFGVWAMPLSHALAANGFNTRLDGDRGGLDLELLERMDRYATATGLEYEVSPNARIYEIGHEHPWAPKKETCSDDAWREMLPAGWDFKAPGPALKDIRRDAGIVVGGDIFNLAEHAETLEREEVIGEILEEFDGDPDDE